jgi:hypothetical protein
LGAAAAGVVLAAVVAAGVVLSQGLLLYPLNRTVLQLVVVHRRAQAGPGIILL